VDQVEGLNYKAILEMIRSDWPKRAACKNEPDPGFLAERTNSGRKNADQEARAKEICSTCPVKMNCLTHALKVPERGGIWGGLNDAERDALAKRLSNPDFKVLRK
jgi:WhiB family transcriptional regulator, redox-sensing transcriptional regulator